MVATHENFSSIVEGSQLHAEMLNTILLGFYVGGRRPAIDPYRASIKFRLKSRNLALESQQSGVKFIVAWNQAVIFGKSFSFSLMRL